MKEEYIRSKTGDYLSLDEIEFSILANEFRFLPFYRDDLFLGMQVMNIGITDPVITEYEYQLLATFIEIEKTPLYEAMTVGAFSQMWIYALYEVLRLWRDRRFDFIKLHKNGGIELKLKSYETDDMNLTLNDRRKQLKKYRDDESFRDEIDYCWEQLEPVYRLIELYRINLAKHVAPGRNNIVPRAPGYGRINMLCGSLDYELIFEKGSYELLNRRDIADRLREVLLIIKN